MNRLFLQGAAVSMAAAVLLGSCSANGNARKSSSGASVLPASSASLPAADVQVDFTAYSAESGGLTTASAPSAPAGPQTALSASETDAVWKSDLYFAMSLFGNASFASTKSLDPSEVVEYCAIKYAQKNGVDSIKKDADYYANDFTLEEAAALAKNYFGLSGIETSGFEDYQYNRAKKTFYIDNIDPTVHAEALKYTYKITKAVKSGGIYTITVGKRNSSGSDKTPQSLVFTLQKNADGSFRYISGQEKSAETEPLDVVQSPVVTGKVTAHAGIDGYSGDVSDFASAGEINGRLLLYSKDYSNRTLTVLLFDPSNFRAERQATVTLGREEGTFYGAKLVGNSLLLKLPDEIVKLDAGLTKSQKIALPKDLLEQSGAGSGLRGYDVSADLKKFAYCTNKEIDLLDAATGKKTVLAQKADCSSPVFVAGDTKVIAGQTQTSYLAYILCDVSAKSAADYDLFGIDTAGVHADAGVLSFNNYVAGSGDSYGEYVSYYIDFQTGTKHVLPAGDTGDIANSSDAVFVGGRYAALAADSGTGSYRSKGSSEIRLLDLKTYQIKTGVAKIQYGSPTLMGVTDDGRILFYANGSCYLTDPAK